jgi:DNA-directed RNA polymerase alpha subunit
MTKEPEDGRETELRDQWATIAFREVLARSGERISEYHAEPIARKAYEFAEAMLRHRRLHVTGNHLTNDIPIDSQQQGISTRLRSFFRKKGVTTWGEVCQYSLDEWLEQKGFGVTALDELKRHIEKLGLKIRYHRDPDRGR